MKKEEKSFTKVLAAISLLSKQVDKMPETKDRLFARNLLITIIDNI